MPAATLASLFGLGSMMMPTATFDFRVLLKIESILFLHHFFSDVIIASEKINLTRNASDERVVAHVARVLAGLESIFRISRQNK